MVSLSKRILRYKHKAAVDVTQPDPTQDQWYTIADLSGGLKIKVVNAKQQNDEAAAKDLDVRLTIDGEVFEYEGDGNGSGEEHFFFLNWGGVPSRQLSYVLTRPCYFNDSQITVDAATGYLSRVHVPLECTRFKMELRLGSAPGTNQTMRGVILHEKLE